MGNLQQPSWISQKRKTIRSLEQTKNGLAVQLLKLISLVIKNLTSQSSHISLKCSWITTSSMEVTMVVIVVLTVMTVVMTVQTCKCSKESSLRLTLTVVEKSIERNLKQLSLLSQRRKTIRSLKQTGNMFAKLLNMPMEMVIKNLTSKSSHILPLNSWKNTTCDLTQLYCKIRASCSNYPTF